MKIVRDSSINSYCLSSPMLLPVSSRITPGFGGYFSTLVQSFVDFKKCGAASPSKIKSASFVMSQ